MAETVTGPVDGPPAKGWVLALTAMASFMVALDAMVVATALSVIRVDFDASMETLEWTVNAYTLSFAVLLLSGAALGDRYGRRRMFAVGLAVFVAASVACALAPDAETLIAARAVQGAGAALVMPLAMALLGTAFPREERAKALGIFSSVTGLALIAGPVVGGIVADGLAWQWIFWINLPIGLAIIPLTLGRCRESFGPAARLDVGGVALATAAALAFSWALMRGNHAGWTSPEILTLLVAGLALAAGFVAWERRAAEPMVPMGFFRIRAFAGGTAASFLFYGAMYSVVFFLPQFFQSAQGFGPLQAGLRLLPWTATLFVFAPIGGALVNRLGERRLIVGGLLMQAAGFAWIGLVAAPDLPFAALVPPMVLAGAGVSLAMPAAQSVVMGSVPPPEMGKASGIFNSARYLGGTFGVAVLVAIFAATGDAGSPEAFAHGFTTVMGGAAALSLTGAVVALGLPGLPRRVTAPAE